MKKLLISIGSLLIMAAIVVLFVNANDSKKETKKAKANVEAAAPCCSQPASEMTATCDPATCTAHAEAAKKEAEACKPTAGCAAKCPMTTVK